MGDNGCIAENPSLFQEYVHKSQDLLRQLDTAASRPFTVVRAEQEEHHEPDEKVELRAAVSQILEYEALLAKSADIMRNLGYAFADELQARDTWLEEQLTEKDMQIDAHIQRREELYEANRELLAENAGISEILHETEDLLTVEKEHQRRMQDEIRKLSQCFEQNQNAVREKEATVELMKEESEHNDEKQRQELWTHSQQNDRLQRRIEALEEDLKEALNITESSRADALRAKKENAELKSTVDSLKLQITELLKWEKETNITHSSFYGCANCHAQQQLLLQPNEENEGADTENQSNQQKQDTHQNKNNNNNIHNNPLNNSSNPASNTTSHGLFPNGFSLGTLLSNIKRENNQADTTNNDSFFEGFKQPHSHRSTDSHRSQYVYGSNNLVAQHYHDSHLNNPSNNINNTSISSPTYPNKSKITNKLQSKLERKSQIAQPNNNNITINSNTNMDVSQIDNNNVQQDENLFTQEDQLDQYIPENAMNSKILDALADDPPKQEQKRSKIGYQNPIQNKVPTKGHTRFLSAIPTSKSNSPDQSLEEDKQDSNNHNNNLKEQQQQQQSGQQQTFQQDPTQDTSAPEDFNIKCANCRKSFQDPYYIFFLLTGQTAKLNSKHCDDILEYDTKPLYPLIKQGVPLNQWYKWIKDKLEAQVPKKA